MDNSKEFVEVMERLHEVMKARGVSQGQLDSMHMNCFHTYMMATPPDSYPVMYEVVRPHLVKYGLMRCSNPLCFGDIRKQFSSVMAYKQMNGQPLDDRTSQVKDGKVLRDHHGPPTLKEMAARSVRINIRI